ncbi:MAG: amino acid ABC transporter ATP-binding protein [Pseudomonas lundensis]|nr:amino acid ABC transporter ATP-binding protein [Pseudomonas lundensis]NLU02171.1 amino acid ABC transporter ATP-binding protein [Pseudomonas lundensis]NNA29292.1 amino acid ABC transporter ATP-binding protein [Pseudomonas lundensis]NNA38472.1 amino acid ABC transporter ATP-binding protein [Pseudomonas lundensis]OZY50584.1 amino acid ABC transporter ATP-binding protein [Pseudomonas lundensis]
MQSVITASEHQSISALTARETVVHISGLNKWYGPFQVLHGIDLTVQQGERIVLCGPSGSGKSTLIRCISHLEVAEEGVIRTLGADLTKPSPARRLALREVGMVFQSFNLFPHMTVLQNCTLAPISVRGLSHQKAAEQARHYLSKVGVENQANKYPSQLSGGQQQRVAIARALCMEPKIMLFDEPTSALDPEMVNEVLEVIVKLAETGMTLLCVTHEMGFARQVADRILFLDAGRIVEDVPPERFFTAPESDRARAFLAQIHR